MPTNKRTIDLRICYGVRSEPSQSKKVGLAGCSVAGFPLRILNSNKGKDKELRLVKMQNRYITKTMEKPQSGPDPQCTPQHS